MSEEVKEEVKESKKSGKWFGWVKNIISAVAGAVISCAATIGIIGTDEADIAKQKVNGWLDKTDTAYTQIVEAQTTVQDAIQMVKDGKYIDAVGKLTTIKDNASTTITVIKELKDEISATAEAIKEDATKKAEEVKTTVQEEAKNVKEAVDAKPADEKTENNTAETTNTANTK